MLIGWGLLLLAWILFALNYDNPDYLEYKAMYENGAFGINSRIEVGYVSIMRISKILGLSFVQFRAMIAGLCLTVMLACFSQYSGRGNTAFFAYMMYPFLFDVIQIRMFIVTTIVLFAIRYLDSFSVANALKYTFCILFATTIQVTAFLFLVLMLAYVTDCKESLKISALLSVTGVVLLNSHTVELAFRLLSFLGSNFVLGSRYATFDPAFKRLMWVYYIISATIILTINIFKYCSSEDITNRRIQQNLLYKLTYLSLLMVPLIQLGSSFGRFYRIMLPIIYCALSCNCAERSETMTTKNLIRVTCLFSIAALLFYAHIYTGSGDTYHRVLLGVVENNYLLKGLFK